MVADTSSPHATQRCAPPPPFPDLSARAPGSLVAMAQQHASTNVTALSSFIVSAGSSLGWPWGLPGWRAQGAPHPRRASEAWADQFNKSIGDWPLGLSAKPSWRPPARSSQITIGIYRLFPGEIEFAGEGKVPVLLSTPQPPPPPGPCHPPLGTPGTGFAL